MYAPKGILTNSESTVQQSVWQVNGHSARQAYTLKNKWEPIFFSWWAMLMIKREGVEYFSTDFIYRWAIRVTKRIYYAKSTLCVSFEYNQGTRKRITMIHKYID